MKNVYAIIVTYNGSQWIEKCLSSLKNSLLPVKIIVIDNASTDDTKTIIAQKFKNINFIESKVNLGFGQANNIGLKIAIENNCDFAFLLNQDAWVEENTLLNLVTVFNINTKLGILSPMHYNGSGTALDNYFLDYLKQSEIKNQLISNYLTGTLPQTVIKTKFVNAAAWLISSACIHKIGGFDPIFFHYGEDRNYTHRALYYGLKIGILTNTKIYHDREKRITETTNIKNLNFKKDWVNELNIFCNIFNKNYKTLILKQIARNFFWLLFSLFKANKNDIKYYYRMLNSIIINVGNIKTSRKISLSKPFKAHL